MNAAYQILDTELKRCTGDGIITESGIKFIHHINPSQKLRFFHKIFPGISSNIINNVENIIGFKVPSSYKNFIFECGGAILFDQSFFLYGFDANVSRSLELDHQKPLYIGQAINDFRLIYPDFFYRSWIPIGSVVLNDKVWILLNKDGRAKIFKEKLIVDFTSFDEFMAHIIPILATGLRCDPLPEGGCPEIEEALFHI